MVIIMIQPSDNQDNSDFFIINITLHYFKIYLYNIFCHMEKHYQYPIIIKINNFIQIHSFITKGLSNRLKNLLNYMFQILTSKLMVT